MILIRINGSERVNNKGDVVSKYDEKVLAKCFYGDRCAPPLQHLKHVLLHFKILNTPALNFISQDQVNVKMVFLR